MRSARSLTPRRVGIATEREQREVARRHDVAGVARPPQLGQRGMLPRRRLDALEPRVQGQDGRPRHAVLQPRPGRAAHGLLGQRLAPLEAADLPAEGQDLRAGELERAHSTQRPSCCTTRPSSSIRPPRPQVLDDVPVDRRLVRAAHVGEAEAEREVHRAVDLLVEVHVAHVARDAGVGTDPELADAPRALVGVERLEQERLLGVGGGVDDPSALEAQPDPAQLAPAPELRELGERDRALGGVLDRDSRRTRRRACCRCRRPPPSAARRATAAGRCRRRRCAPPRRRRTAPRSATAARCSASQSSSTAPYRKSSNAGSVMPASWASAGVGYQHMTHGKSFAPTRRRGSR